VNPKLQKVQRVLRDFGLLAPVEALRYLVSIAQFKKRNREFVAVNPDFRLPPTALAYDAYSAPEWKFYRVSGEETAKFLSGINKRYLRDGERIRLLEWGCGPARVIRHVNAAFAPGTEAYGSDYNPATIRSWQVRGRQEDVQGLSFAPISARETLQPPLGVGAWRSELSLLGTGLLGAKAGDDVTAASELTAGVSIWRVQ